jgi:hypothetical protein
MAANFVSLCSKVWSAVRAAVKAALRLVGIGSPGSAQAAANHRPPAYDPPPGYTPQPGPGERRLQSAAQQPVIPLVPDWRSSRAQSEALGQSRMSADESRNGPEPDAMTIERLQAGMEELTAQQKAISATYYSAKHIARNLSTAAGDGYHKFPDGPLERHQGPRSEDEKVINTLEEQRRQLGSWKEVEAHFKLKAAEQGGELALQNKADAAKQAWKERCAKVDRELEVDEARQAERRKAEQDLREGFELRRKLHMAEQHNLANPANPAQPQATPQQRASRPPDSTAVGPVPHSPPPPSHTAGRGRSLSLNDRSSSRGP